MDTVFVVGIIVLALVLFVIGYFLLRQNRKTVVPEELDRHRYAHGFEEYMDEEMEEAISRRIFTCPNCNEQIGAFDEECPHCNARLKMGEFECPNCGETVDPRDRECNSCGEILTPDAYVCPKCFSVVEPDSNRCDSCATTYWSPIQLDEKTLQKKRNRFNNDEEVKEKEEEEIKPRRR